MQISKDINVIIKNTILGSVKVPHGTSQPVIYQDPADGRYYLAAFVFFFSGEDIRKGMVSRPSLWAIYDIETGDLVQRFSTKDKEFSGAPYDVKYDIHADGTYDTSAAYYNAAYDILDQVREKIMSEGILDRQLYDDYLRRIVFNIATDKRILITDWSVIAIKCIVFIAAG